MIVKEKIQKESDEIEDVAQTIEAVVKDEIKPGLELLGQAIYQLESGETDKARDLLTEAARKFDLSFDDESSALHQLSEDAEGCCYDFEEDPHPGYRVGQ